MKRLVCIFSWFLILISSGIYGQNRNIVSSTDVNGEICVYEMGNDLRQVIRIMTPDIELSSYNYVSIFWQRNCDKLSPNVQSMMLRFNVKYSVTWWDKETLIVNKYEDGIWWFTSLYYIEDK